MGKSFQGKGFLSSIRRGCVSIRQFLVSFYKKCRSVISTTPCEHLQQKEPDRKNYTKKISKSQLRKYVARRARLSPKLGQNKIQQTSIENDRLQFKSQQRTKLLDFLSFIEKHTEEIICSICRQQLLKPVKTVCNHAFCLQCIEKALLISQNCPLCRHPVSTQQQYGLNQYPFVQLFVTVKYQRNQSKDYEERMKEYANWKDQRFIRQEQISVGLKIDVWKLQSKEWKPAQILELQKNGNNTSLLIKYDQQGKQSNEIIDLPTLRIAKYQYYSRGKPKYQLTLTSYRIHNNPAESAEFQFGQPVSRRWNLTSSLSQRPNPFLFVTNRMMTMRRVSAEEQVAFPNPASLYSERIRDSLRNFDSRNTNALSSSQSQVQNAVSTDPFSNRLTFEEIQVGNLDAVRLDHLNPQNVENVEAVEQRHSEIELLLNLNPRQVIQGPSSQDDGFRNISGPDGGVEYVD